MRSGAGGMERAYKQFYSTLDSPSAASESEGELEAYIECGAGAGQQDGMGELKEGGAVQINEEEAWSATPPLSHPTATRPRPSARRPPTRLYGIQGAEQGAGQQELVLAEFVSSHSLLDSILTTIDVDNQKDERVEFPEFGRSLGEGAEGPGEAALTSRVWQDNWRVEGVDKLEEQLLVERREVVPFLVPDSGDHLQVIIGKNL